MSPFTFSTVLQLVVAVGLLNVWLVRPESATSFRGGRARSLKDEFAEYGLPGFAGHGREFLSSTRRPP